jgi:hypothetical protein
MSEAMPFSNERGDKACDSRQVDVEEALPALAGSGLVCALLEGDGESLWNRYLVEQGLSWSWWSILLQPLQTSC